jgi:CheY-like chemotaxis protein
MVEDCQDDADLMIDALKEGDLAVRVSLVEDGEQAVDYLLQQGPFADAPRPDLILLDLHLPRLSGHEVLAVIKKDLSLRLIPVVILTSSTNEAEILRAYDLHANCCVIKPSNQDEYAQAVQTIERFWLSVAHRPRTP